MGEQENTTSQHDVDRTFSYIYFVIKLHDSITYN